MDEEEIEFDVECSLCESRVLITIYTSEQPAFCPMCGADISDEEW